MGEKDVVKALRGFLKRQSKDFKFRYSRSFLTRDEMLKKLDNDRKFRKFMVRIVEGLSIDLLSRSPEEIVDLLFKQYGRE